MSTSVKPMDDLPKSKSGESQTQLNKTDLPTSGDDRHVARRLTDLEEHLPTDVESVSSSKKHLDSYTVHSCASRSSTTSKNIAIVSSSPNWPLRSLMPKGSLRVRKFKKPLIEPIERNAALKKGQGLTLNEPKNRLKKTPNELVKKLKKKKDYALRKRLECV